MNNSNWIRIEMDAHSTPPPNAMPYGHGSYFTPFAGYETPKLQYSHASQYERQLGRYFNGAVFNQQSPDGILEMPRSARDTLELFQPLPFNSDDAGSGYYMDELKVLLKKLTEKKLTTMWMQLMYLLLL